MCLNKLVERAAALVPRLSRPAVGYTLSGTFGGVSAIGADVAPKVAELAPQAHAAAETVFLWIARVGIVFATLGGILTFLIQLHNWRKIRREKQTKENVM